MYPVTRDGCFHLIEACPAISGGVKWKKYAAAKYRLCPVCETQHTTDVHKLAEEYHRDFRDNAKQFLSNVTSSNLPHQEQADIFTRGLVGMMILDIGLHAMDDLNRGRGGR